jgi:anti-sigma factor RsiW
VKHSEIRARLSEYLERDLPAEERARIGAHLESCSDCERELGELRDTVSLLRGLPEPALPPGIGAAVMARIAQGEGREARVYSLFRRMAEPRFAAPLAAGLAGLFFLVQSDGPETGRVVASNVERGNRSAASASDASGDFAAQRAAFELAWREARDGSDGAHAGVVSEFTPTAVYQRYITQVRMDAARRRSEAHEKLRQLRGAGHPISASLATHSDPRPNVVLADWQPR